MGHPTMGICLTVENGKYRKSSFNKSVMNRCATSIIRELIQKSSKAIEPIMEVSLAGSPAMIEQAARDISQKRGQILEHGEEHLEGVIPVVEVQGWIKDIRAMGLDISLKYYGYSEVSGADPEELLRRV